MHLPSRLSTSTLGDLLGSLHRQRTTGLLELCELWTPSGKTVPGRLHRIQLFAGLVTAVDTPLQAQRRSDLREQLRARLDALFTIEEAAICFHTARPLADALRRVGPLPPSEFLHGRPRARDRVRAAGRTAGRAPHHAAPPRRPLDEPRRRALQLLGLGEGASEAEVRRAFRRLAARLHPDRDSGPQSTARFAEISAAYHLLVA